jgi:outer membrane protein TolC
LALLSVTLAMVAGCHPQQPFFFHENGDMSHYRGVATEIEYPDAKVESLGDVAGASAPLTLSNPEPREIWDLSLEEAMHIALANAKVMKQLGAAAINNAGTSGPNAPSFLTNNPSAAASVYDPALIETDGRTGVEAALAAFDAQLSANMSWQRVDTPNNYNPANNVSTVTLGDAATFQSSLAKTTATGGTVAVNTTVDYQLTENTPLTPPLFNGAYTTTVEFAATQPLLQGAGVTFNQIAGPGGLPGFNNGVLIARINTDIALATFEANIRNMVADVETAYWELYFSYRNLDSVVAGRDAALSTWRRIYALAVVGARGGEAEKEAQAREQYFLFRSSTEQALGALYKAESNMRYMMGLATSDGRLIRPKDEPTTARVAFDWYQIHCEALARNPELREQKWTVKRRELEVVAAKNYLLPRLDAVAKYDFIGLGQNLLSANSQLDTSTLAGREGYAINNLLMGDYQQWTLGFEFKMPLGFRKEMANVRNTELRLARERAVLQEQELELSHQLGFAVRDLDANYVLSESDFNRRVAGQREVDAVQAAYDTGTITLDVLLLAQRNLFQAESDYYRAVVDYNKSIIQVHLRKGSLLEYNGIYLAEGPWPGKAYFDAKKLARARSAGIYLDYGYTRPGVVSRGPINQNAGQETGAVAVPTPAQSPSGGNPEMVPPPLPETPAADGRLPSESGPAVKAIGPQAGGPVMNGSLAATAPAAAGMTAAQRDGTSSGAAAANSGRRWVPAATARIAPDGGWKVRQASYQEPLPAGQNAAAAASGDAVNNATKANAGDESLPNSPFAESDRTAAGWKGAQH